MADGLICSSRSEQSENGLSNGSLVPRKIEFHLARNPFLGFAKVGGNFRLETLNPGYESARTGCGLGHVAGKKSDGPEHPENWLDPELTFGITVRKIGAGLQNLGNTCFLNSVLQCLTYTEPLAAYLQSGKHQVSCRIAGFCALCAIQKHVSRALQSSGRILAPKDLVSNLRCISRSFRNARQEDAHEYMVNLLESMHKCCLPSGVSSESPSAYEKSLVHKIFGGSLRSQVKCMHCSYCSNKFDPFLDLSLEIIKAESLHKALLHFTAKEQLDGGERHYQCQRCRQKVRALKQLTVYKAPYVLTIHLKRFASHDPGQKIDKKVHFGPTLDLKAFVSGSNEEELKYTLYGVLVHAGWSTRSGHYYCYVRTSTGMWYSLDDNRVFQVSEKTVLEQKAYMLFYVRDRKISSKKPVDVWRESLGSNLVENRTCSSSKQAIKETVLNDSSVKKINGMATSAAAVKRDATDVNLLNETTLKQAAGQNINGLAIADSFAIKREPEVEFPSVDQQETVSKHASVQKINGLAVADSSAVKREAASEISLMDENKMLKQASVLKVNGQATEDASALKTEPVLESSLKAPVLGPVKGVADPVPNNGDLFNVPVTVGTKLIGCNEERNSSKKPTGLSTCNGQPESEKAFLKVEGIIKESAAMDSASEKANGSVPDSVIRGLVKSSSPLIKVIGSLDVKCRGRKIRKISNKKLLKYGVASMHLGYKFLLGASLTVRKKKHKRSKQRPLGAKGLSQQNFSDGDRVSTDLGPSTSEKTNRISVPSTQSQRKRLKSREKRTNGIAGKDDLNACAGFQAEPVDGELKERIGQLSATLNSNNNQLQKSAYSNVASNQRVIGEPESLDGGRTSVQNGMMSTLTRGLEDSIVAQWDEIELPLPSQMLESAPADGPGIGYVLDEWDEEYDRGKRKKLRQSKRDFGGPNPFQEIATRKAQLKKPKIERSRSGDQPFRI